MVYHLASEDKGKIKNKKQELLRKASPEELFYCSFHIILDPTSPDFASIRAKDPYFDKAVLCSSLDEFVNSLRDKMSRASLR